MNDGFHSRLNGDVISMHDRVFARLLNSENDELRGGFAPWKLRPRARSRVLSPMLFVLGVISDMKGMLSISTWQEEIHCTTQLLVFTMLQNYLEKNAFPLSLLLCIQTKFIIFLYSLLLCFQLMKERERCKTVSKPNKWIKFNHLYASINSFL